MYASIYNARKATGFKFELLAHTEPSIAGDSVKTTLYFQSKAEAKAFAKAAGYTAWNY